MTLTVALLGALAGLAATATAEPVVAGLGLLVGAAAAVATRAGGQRRAGSWPWWAALAVLLATAALRRPAVEVGLLLLGGLVSALAALLAGQGRPRLAVALGAGPMVVLLARAPAAVPDERALAAGVGVLGLLAVLPDRWGTRPVHSARLAAGALTTALAVGALLVLTAQLLPLPAPRAAATPPVDPDAVLLEVPASGPQRWRIGALAPSPTSDTARFAPPPAGASRPLPESVSSAGAAGTLPLGSLGGVVPAPPGRVSAASGLDRPVLGDDGLVRTDSPGPLSYRLAVQEDDLALTAVATTTFADVDNATAGLAGRVPGALREVLAGSSPAERAGRALSATVDQAAPVGGAPGPLTDRRLAAVVGGAVPDAFELAAARARLASLAGLPARVAVGLAGGQVAGDVRRLRARDQVFWTELRVADGTWLPVTFAATGDGAGGPAGGAPDSSVGVSLFVPVLREPQVRLDQRARAGLLAALATATGLAAVAVAAPVLLKAHRRRARRTWGARTGTRERVAAAYAEVRELCSDLGAAGAPTPGAFLARLTLDDEHTELAALVTRALWRHDLPPLDAADGDRAEALELSLRSRLLAAQPFERALAARMSWTSLRRPWSTEIPIGVGWTLAATEPPQRVGV